MEPCDILKRQKKVGGSTLVKINEDYRDQNYIGKRYPFKKATNTGLVKFYELIPKKNTLPKFICRWDWENDSVDVDIYNDGKLNNKKLWKKPGFKGHHPKKVKNNPSQYKIDIRIPGKQIFKGIIDIGVDYQLQPKSGALGFEGKVPLICM